MKISNAKVFINGAFVDGGLDFGATVTAVGEAVDGGIDANGCYLIPGLIDSHTHAAMGEDASDGEP